MKRIFLKAGAAVGVASLAVMTAGPAMAADPVSQASAQSLNLTIGGQSVISQMIEATNDGKKQTKSSDDTLPDIAGLIPGNSLLGIGAAPQDAGANKDGTSYACAGVAGTGGGIVHTGNTECNINGQPLTLDLGNLKLGDILIDANSALGNIPGISALLNALGKGLNQVVTQLGGALAGTPLGDIKLGGSLSAIEAICTATPTSADGKVSFLDTSGDKAPISISLPGVGKMTLVNLPANPDPNTHVVTGLDKVVGMLTDALSTQLTTMLNGQLDALGIPLSGLLKGQVQDLVNTLVKNLQPLLKPLEDNVLDITLNKQPDPQEKGRFEATALDLQVLPAAAQFLGTSLISGEMGKVSCGPNRAPGTTPTNPPTNPPTNGHNPPGPKHHPTIPTKVNSGVDGSDTARNLAIGGTSLLLLVSGGAATMAYRRFRFNQ